MQITTEQRPLQHVAGFRETGPWPESVPRAFTQLDAWVSANGLSGNWMALYYDNPDEVPAAQLRVDAVITVDTGFQLPAESGKAQLLTIPAAEYAVQQVRLSDLSTMEALWRGFIGAVKARWDIAESPVLFEHYVTDGSATGEWVINFGVPVVARKA